MIQPSIDMLNDEAFRLKEKVNATHFPVTSPPFDLLITDPVIRFYSCCFKREFQLEAWLYNIVICFPIRAACSFTLVFWDEDQDAMHWLEKLQTTCRPLIVDNYVSLHHAKGMPYWNASIAKNTAALCASMLTDAGPLTEAGPSNRKSFLVNPVDVLNRPRDVSQGSKYENVSPTSHVFFDAAASSSSS